MIFPHRFYAIIVLLSLTAVSGCATSPDSKLEDQYQLPEGHPQITKNSINFRDLKADAYAGFIHGLLLAAEGQYDKAVGYLGMSAQLDTTSPAPLIEIMRIYLETGQRERAEETGKKALGIDENLAEVHIALGQVFLEANRISEALFHLNKGTQLDPENVSALFPLAEVLERSGDPEAAAEILEKLAATEGHEALAHYYIARLRIRSGDITGAVDPLVRAVELNPSFLKAVDELGEQLGKDGRTEDAIRLYQGYLAKDPDRTPVRESLAKVYLLERRYDEARSQLRSALEKDSDNYSALLLLGLVESQDGNYEKALELFKRLRQASGDSFEVLMQIGSLQRELELFTEAETTFEKAAEVSPERYEPHLNLAVLYGARDDLTSAEVSARKALSLQPERSNIRSYMAELLTRQKRYDEAVILLEEGLSKNPRDTVLLYQLGITHDQSGQFELTESVLKKLLEIDPNHTDAMNYLGYTWADMGVNLDKALGLITKALEIRPDAAYIIDSLGWVYYRMGQYEEALEWLLKAAEKMPDDPTVLEHIGDTYEKLGQGELAVQYWSRALAADPGNPDISQKIKEKEVNETSP
jgi:tetratricopeptide (TPR) repeat protein